MQEPTHILAGVIIQRSFESVRPRALALGLTAVCAFLSHGLLDRLANATYHPPNPDFNNPFWVSFHAGVVILTVVFLFVWWRRYKWGIFFAALPDLDWVFIHGREILIKLAHDHPSLQTITNHLPYYHKPYMHNLLHVVFNVWPPFKYLKVPTHRFKPWACLWEVALVLAMLAVIYFLTQNRPVPPAAIPAPAETSSPPLS